MTGRATILALRKVELPAEATELEQLVHEVERVASALYALHLYLDQVKEADGAATAHLLHGVLDRQAGGLRQLMHREAAAAG